MFKDVTGFNQHRTPEMAVDTRDYQIFLRSLTSIALRGAHHEVFAQRSLPQATWSRRRNEDDVLLGFDAFPEHPETGTTHIQIFAEGHPIYQPFGINAVVGSRDDEGAITLWAMSTDGGLAWINELHTGRPITSEELEQLKADFQDVVT